MEHINLLILISGNSERGGTMKKRILTVLLTVTSAASLLAGCGSAGGTGDSAVSGEETSSTAAAKTSTVADTVEENPNLGSNFGGPNTEEPWMIGDPDNPIKLSVFLNHTWYGTESFTGIIPEEITKRTGITLEPTKATDYTQLGVMTSSGELPDLVFTSQMLDTLSDPNVSYAYDDLISQYCPTWEVDPSNIINAKAFSSDDHNYFLFSHTSSNKDWENTRAVPMVQSIDYRKDMLDELGMDEPTNLDELNEVFAAVKKKWPDVTPLVFATTTWTLTVFRPYNGCTLQDFVLNDDGTCDFTPKTQAYKDYLKYCNSLYRNGYIQADNFSWESADAQAAMNSGKAFAVCGNTQESGAAYLTSLKETDPNATIWEMKPLSDDKLINSEIGWCGTFITKNNTDPAASIRFMQFLFSDEGQKLSQWGREGIEYTINDKGLPEFSEEWQKSIDNNTNTEIYNTNFYFGGSKILEAEARCAVQPEQYQASNDAIRATYDNQEWYVYASPKESDGEYKEISDKIADYLKTQEAKIILSESDEEFENNYNEEISQLENMGCNKLTEWMGPRLADAKKLFREDGEE